MKSNNLSFSNALCFTTLGLKPAPKALFMHIDGDEVSTQVAKQLWHIAIFFK